MKILKDEGQNVLFLSKLFYTKAGHKKKVLVIFSCQPSSPVNCIPHSLQHNGLRDTNTNNRLKAANSTQIFTHKPPLYQAQVHPRTSEHDATPTTDLASFITTKHGHISANISTL